MASGTFVSVSRSQTLFMCYFYMIVGPLAIVANLINLTVFLSDSKMRRIQILSIALYFGEIINGISYIMTGYGRLWHYQQGILFSNTTVRDCNINHNWVVWLIMGTEIPAMLVIAISVERILAVTKPAWFNRKWKTSTKFLCIIAVAVVEMLSLLASGFSARHEPRVVYTHHCAIIDSTSKAYSTTHFAFIALAYVVSFVSLVIVYVTTRVSCTFTLL
uniref:G_PROTEIN_RECEP_F1_2 domain-containing protein n=1 Tax=Syphacia muris TaxID=451379 RepID=A0A0N5ANL3_9BILA